MISQQDKHYFNKLSSKTKINAHGPNYQLSILDFMTKKKNLDSGKNNAISEAFIKLENQSHLEESNQIENIDLDIEMKNENENMNVSFKDSLNSEQMTLSNEEKVKISNDSLNNIENSYGDNYSTDNSNIENKLNKKLTKEKNKKDFDEKIVENNDMKISKEKEIERNSQVLQNVEEYIEEIFGNLIDEEKNLICQINPNYFKYQTEINPSMRSILIDWLIDVHNRFQFKEETIYISIYIIDNYLSKKIIQSNKLQLLGITSLFIASKVNEIYIRRISDYVLITDNSYSINDIKFMEEEISKTLNFNFLVPSSLSFYEIIAKKCGISEDLDKYHFGEFLIQSFLIDYRSLYSYSSIACACCYIVMKFYKIKNYHICYDNKYYSVKSNHNYNYNSKGYMIKECAQYICSVISELFISNQQSTIRKYSSYHFIKEIKKIIFPEKK